MLGHVLNAGSDPLLACNGTLPQFILGLSLGLEALEDLLLTFDEVSCGTSMSSNDLEQLSVIQHSAGILDNLTSSRLFS